MPKPFEVAELVVNGQSFHDWETVWVHQELNELFRTFRFTCSEGSPQAPRLAEMQITPGDLCDITLGGQPAIHGYVYQRDAAYDANRHTVMIAGQSVTGDSTRVSIMIEPPEFINYTLPEIARRLLSEQGIGLVIKGGNSLLNEKIPRAVAWPGETPFEFIARHGRMRGVIITDDKQGSMVLNAYEPGGSFAGGLGAGNGELVEGVNIISARASIVDLYLISQATVIAQRAGNDQTSGSANNELRVDVMAGGMAGRGRYKPYKMLLEEPASSLAVLMARAKHEIAWRNTEAITVEIVHYGWFTGGTTGKLWEAMDNAHVTSPMLGLNMDLIVKAVTFTQDNATGTRTTLELANPQAIGIGTTVIPGPGGGLGLPGGGVSPSNQG